MSSQITWMKIICVVVLLTLPARGVYLLENYYNLCEKGEIRASNGKISFNSSSLGWQKNDVTCERIIYATQGSGRLSLAMNHVPMDNDDFVFDVIDGAWGTHKINSVDVKGRNTYEASGDTIKIVLNIPQSFNNSAFLALEGTFTTKPFPTTCKCSGIQNGFMKCNDSFMERKCTSYCKKDFVDLFKEKNAFTCNVLTGKWDSDYKNGIGCAASPTLPDVLAQVNFTIEKPMCKAMQNNISDIFYQFFRAQDALSRNSLCLKGDFSKCVQSICRNEGDVSIVSVNIRDKATSIWNESETDKHEALIDAYNTTLMQSKGKIADEFFRRQNDAKITNDSMVHSVFTKCSPGTFEIGSKFTCSKCPQNAFYNSIKRTCEKCPNGTYSPEGSTECNQTSSAHSIQSGACEIQCMAGKGLDKKTDFCQWCPHGTYANNSTTNCTVCPFNKKTLHRGTSSDLNCHEACSKGEFFDNIGKCRKCPLGTYRNSTDLLTWCTKCSNGKVTHAVGGKELSDCVPSCEKGHFFNDVFKNCTKCPVGSYQNVTNQVKCEKCPDGTTTESTGSRDISECRTACPKGTHFNSENRTCQMCPLETFMDNANHFLLSCKNCSSNKTTYVEGAEQCKEICNTGQYFNLSKSSCMDCAIGSYQNSLKQLKCIQCSNGLTTRITGSSTPSDCIKTCPEGTFYHTHNSSCALCSIGTYMEKQGHFETECRDCGEKKTTYVEGASKASQCLTKCTVGKYFNLTLSSCQDCPRGSYQTKPGQKSCTTCPPGLSTKHTGTTSNLQCVEEKVLCGQGEFHDHQKQSCHLCEQGTYQSAANHTLTSCQSCITNKTHGKGAKDISECIEGCDSFSCRNGAECRETSNAFICLCPKGISGKRCDVIENKDKLQRIDASVRFTSLVWSEALADHSSLEYKQMSHKIEMALRTVFEKESGFTSIQVTNLISGSVIAEFDIFMNENASLVPAKTLQQAVAQGSVGGLPVDTSSLHIKQTTCLQALGMENGRIKDAQIDKGTGKGRLHGVAWSWNMKNTSREYLEVQFDNNVNITAIASEGDGNGSFVKSYLVQYSTDGSNWNISMPKEGSKYYTLKMYQGNNDTSSVVKNTLTEPLTLVKFVRIYSGFYEKRHAMRIELYGCISDQLPKPSQPSPTEGPEKPVKTEPDVQGVQDKKKDEYAWGQYLGIAFGVIMAIVVVVSCFVWWRRSKRKNRKEDAPLVLTQVRDGSYRQIDRDQEEEDTV